MAETLPRAIHQGVMTIAGVQVKTYVLDTGARVLDAEDLHRVQDALKAGADITSAEAEAYADFYRGKGIPETMQ